MRARCSGSDKNGQWLVGISRTSVGLPGVSLSASSMNSLCAAAGMVKSAVQLI
jgi:hypothetical protein